MEIIPVLHNIRSTYNVGAILRTAEGLGVKRVLCSGYTPWSKKPGLLPHQSAKLERQIHKSALGAETMLDVTYVDNLKTELEALRKQGFQIVGLENNLATPTLKLNDPNLKLHLKNNIVLLLGEEVNGIPTNLYPLIDLFLEIPMRGQKESFNVSVAAAIALYALDNLEPAVL